MRRTDEEAEGAAGPRETGRQPDSDRKRTRERPATDEMVTEGRQRARSGEERRPRIDQQVLRPKKEDPTGEMVMAFNLHAQTTRPRPRLRDQRGRQRATETTRGGPNCDPARSGSVELRGADDEGKTGGGGGGMHQMRSLAVVFARQSCETCPPLSMMLRGRKRLRRC